MENFSRPFEVYSITSKIDPSFFLTFKCVTLKHKIFYSMKKLLNLENYSFQNFAAIQSNVMKERTYVCTYICTCLQNFGQLYILFHLLNN